ncbi:MAG: isoprenoid biosynthesis glyoxalase ElbB [Cyclobacteriaceae bacterium]|nr:isoprenoid biosynthesis glyoxalase ElbB [Cyclobacteriaceae bacterium]
MKIGVIFSGSGVYDGTEIQEGVFTLLAIKKVGGEAVCFAPDIEQHDVVNHLTGEAMKEKRNVLVESARIVRGNIRSLATFNASELSGLVIPGGFGAAKNLTMWAFDGPAGEINTEVKNAIISMVKARKPVAGLCMGPTVIAKALEGSGISATLTVGTNEQPSPYDITEISRGMETAGAMAVMRTVEEVAVDKGNKIVTAPCYMMEADILQIRNNVQKAVEALVGLM